MKFARIIIYFTAIKLFFQIAYGYMFFFKRSSYTTHLTKPATLDFFNSSWCNMILKQYREVYTKGTPRKRYYLQSWPPRTIEFNRENTDQVCDDVVSTPGVEMCSSSHTVGVWLIHYLAQAKADQWLILKKVPKKCSCPRSTGQLKSNTAKEFGKLRFNLFAQLLFTTKHILYFVLSYHSKNGMENQMCYFMSKYVEYINHHTVTESDEKQHILVDCYFYTSLILNH